MPRGGARVGAGRPKGQGKYKESTRPIRVPESLVGSVMEFVESSGYSLPLYACSVQAGFPSPATDYVEDDIDLNIHLIKNIPSTFLIRVQGKSMNKVGIHNDDLLVVDRSLNPKNFSTVIVNINEELVVKTFIKEKNQSFLTSGSKEIKDKINLTENPEIFIWGVVTYVIHAL